MTEMPAKVIRDRRFTSIASFLRTMAVSALTMAVTGCAGYLPGRQTYWDALISEKCKVEGAVQIIEPVVLTREEVSRLPRVNGKLATRPNTNDAVGDPVYSERAITILRDRNPRVSKEEVRIIRRSDGKTVARWVEYARVGGDVPTGISHDSSFRCPDPRQRLEELQQLFIVKGS